MQSGIEKSAAGCCLNCGADLNGAFCGACGQRSVPADPTVSELAGDAWQELSGYDGRISATFRNLLKPGRLTIDYLQGRRARYLSPVRLYLAVSVIYFVVAAAAPLTTESTGGVTGPGGLKFTLTQPREPGAPVMTAEDRAEVLKNAADAPWIMRPLFRALAEDPEGFRARLFTIAPRVFFGLLPVFAAIVSLFYRQRRFPTALVFAVHLHAFAFLILSFSEAAKFTRQPIVMAVVGLAAVITLMVYTLRAARAVFGGGWPMTLVKAAAVGVVYMLASVPAFFIILFWASLT